jgi:hypothetical protein
MEVCFEMEELLPLAFQKWMDPKCNSIWTWGFRCYRPRSKPYHVVSDCRRIKGLFFNPLELKRWPL